MNSNSDLTLFSERRVFDEEHCLGGSSIELLTLVQDLRYPTPMSSMAFPFDSAPFDKLRTAQGRAFLIALLVGHLFCRLY
jgi:hypothetical protein